MQNASCDTQAKLSGLTADQILAIPAQEPEWLYSNNADMLRHEYRHLAKIWYPDINKTPRAADVFKHIDALRRVADAKIASGTWQKPGELSLTKTDGRTVQLQYVKKHDFALGQLYIDESAVTYVIRLEYKGLYDNAVKTIGELSFADTKMRDQCSLLLPHIVDAFTAEEGHVLILRKAPELVSLRDALDHSGKIESRHAAWILSALHNLSCYLSWADLTHNDISPDTVFVAPKGHYATLLGGWWYATPKGRPLSHFPDRTYDHAPPDVVRNGKADPRVDLGLIRLTGRELLGDPDGHRLSLDKTVPASLAAWLRMPTSGDAKEDYRTWIQQVLKESFGVRRYAEMNLNFGDVYNQGEKPWAPPQKKTSSPNTPPPIAPSSASSSRSTPPARRPPHPHP